MFLLPPVPGVPVYLSGGVILTRPIERALGGDGHGGDLHAYGMALVVVCGICLGIKLLAVVVQQKV